MRKTFVLLPLAVAMLAAGCSFAPTYERPEAPVAQSWPQSEATRNVQVLTEGLQQWGDFFTDERLCKLIETGLSNNRSLRAAVLSVEQARAQYNVSRSQLLPSVSAVAQKTARGAFDNDALNHSSSMSNGYTANAMASYELDLFGRVRNTNEMALQTYFQTEAAQRTAQMTVITEIANTWLGLGAAKDLLTLANNTLESQKKSHRLIKGSYELGASSLIDVQQAETTVANARIAQAQAMRQVAQYRNALTLLVGGPFDASLEPETLSMDVTKPISAISNVPSEVLLNRPDIASAEAALKSANANIGVARAAFFPSISLTSSAGFTSAHLSDLFKSGSAVWSFAPSVSLPIFQGGRNIQNLKAAEAAKKAAVAQYEATIQTAFKEVADALATEGTIQDQLMATQALADSTRKTYKLAMERYNSGVDSFLQVLDSQRSDFSAQQSLVNARLSRVASLVTLYKVMGGGSQLPQAEAGVAQTEGEAQDASQAEVVKTSAAQ